jgi:hypothetical protein
MLGYRCNRVAVGPFERGPVTFVFDTHTNAEFPEECIAGNNPGTTTEVLHIALVDDAEVAAFLSVTYGMPVLAAEMTQDAQPATPPNVHTWTWKVGDQPESKLSVVEDGAAATPPEGSNRFYWAAAGGIGSLRLAYERTAPLAVGNRAGEGTLQPPMLLSQVAGGSYAGPAEWFSSLSADGVFAFYKDPGCEEPEG